MPALQGGGAERMTINLVEHLSLYFKIKLVLIKNIIEYDTPPLLKENIKSLGHKKLPLKLCYLSPGVLNSLILQAKTSDLVVGGLELSPTYVSFLTAKLAGRPFLSIVHSVLSEHITYSPLSFIHFPLCKNIYKNCNQIIAVSNSVGNDLYKHFGIKEKKLKIILNPINIKYVQEMALAEPDLNLNKNNYLVSVGRLSRQKGFDILIKAFSKMAPETRPDLIILGEGSERASLSNLIKRLGLSKWVYMPGFIKNPYSIISRARAFVFPSRYEGFGIALLEAMACGIPIVASQISPIEEVCGKDGAIYFPPGNEEALSQAIVKISKDNTLRKNLIDIGLKRAKKLDIEKVAEKYREIFNNI